MVTAVRYRDANPPYLFPAYDSTVDRAPKEPLIEAPPEWIGQSPGPGFGRVPLPPDGADLLRRGPGEPIGERIAVEGRVLGNNGWPLPGALVPAGRRPPLIARHDGDGLRFDIRLQGAGETPFFGF